MSWILPTTPPWVADGWPLRTVGGFVRAPNGASPSPDKEPSPTIDPVAEIWRAISGLTYVEMEWFAGAVCAALCEIYPGADIITVARDLATFAKDYE